MFKNMFLMKPPVMLSKDPLQDSDISMNV